MLFLNWTSSSDPGIPTRAEVAGASHWNLWRIRQPPFKDLADGSEVVLVDTWPGGGRLTWQVRAQNVVASDYSSKADAVRQIASALGLRSADVRTHDYTQRGPDAGVLLAWSYRPVRRLDLPRPPDMRFRPNGWLREDDPGTLRRWGLSKGQTASRKEAAPRRSPIGQGRLDVAERFAVEAHAMDRAEDWCRQNGWPIVEDVSRRSSWDLEARKRRNGRPLFVEVKGTTGRKLEVEVTEGEVRHARANPRDTVLIVVTDIVLKRGKQPGASGGKLHSVYPWSPEDNELRPTRYRWKSRTASDHGL